MGGTNGNGEKGPSPGSELEEESTGQYLCSLDKNQLVVSVGVFMDFLVTLPRRRNSQVHVYILIHGLWPMTWMDSHGLERNMIGNLCR